MTDEVLPDLSLAEFDASRRELERTKRALQHEAEERRRVEAALKAYAHRLDHLHATQTAILSAQSLSDTLDITIRHIKNSLPCLSATLVTYDFDRNELEVLASDRAEFPAGDRLPILMHEVIEELRHGRHYIIPDVLDPAVAQPALQTAADLGGRTMLLLPLRYRDELIGAMTVTTGQVHAFTPEELVIGQEIASSLAVAIQYRRWLAAEQEAREREATLHKVAQSLTADLELDTVLHGILDQLEKIVPTTSSAIFLRDGGGLRVTAYRGPVWNIESIEMFLAGRPSLMHHVLASGQTYSIPDTRLEPQWVTLRGGEYIRSWLGIPLTVKGKTIGLLTLDRDTPDSFEEQDIARATILAAQAAIGIENARLFRQEQEAALRLERDVQARTKELQALYEISAAAGDNLESQLLLDFSLSRALLAVDYDAGAVHVIDDKRGDLNLATTMGLTATEQAALGPSGAIGAWLAQQMMTSSVPWISSTDDHQLPICAMFASCVLVPLRARGHVLGTLLLMNRTERTLSEPMQKLLVTVADQIGLVIESMQLRQQARQTAVLAERERIARDLHDVVTQSIYSLINFAEAARESAVAGDMVEVQRTAQSIMQTAQQALGEMRVLLYDLRSDVLASRGLAQALAERLTTVEQRGGLATTLAVEGVERLSPELEDVFYRVALEALNNTFRHAEATSVSVQVEVTPETAVLRVIDDGRGFDVPDGANGPGMGLSNMQRRARVVGGTLRIHSGQSQGTELEFRVPLSQPNGGRHTLIR